MLEKKKKERKKGSDRGFGLGLIKLGREAPSDRRPRTEDRCGRY